MPTIAISVKGTRLTFGLLHLQNSKKISNGILGGNACIFTGCKYFQEKPSERLFTTTHSYATISRGWGIDTRKKKDKEIYITKTVFFISW